MCNQLNTSCLNKDANGQPAGSLCASCWRREPNEFLLASAWAGYIAGITAALAAGADIHYGSNQALRLAAEYNPDPGLLKLLLDAGADPKAAFQDWPAHDESVLAELDPVNWTAKHAYVVAQLSRNVWEFSALSKQCKRPYHVRLLLDHHPLGDKVLGVPAADVSRLIPGDGKPVTPARKNQFECCCDNAA